MLVTFEPNDSEQTRVEKLNQLQTDLAVSPLIDFEPNDSQQTRSEKLNELQTEAGISPVIDFQPNDSEQTRAAQLNSMSGGGGSSFPAGATHYWTLNEASGARADSIGGLDFSVVGGVTQVSGPLDNAVEVNEGAGHHSLISSSIPSLRATGFWTFNFWQRFPGDPDNFDTISQGTGADDANIDVFIRANSNGSASRIGLDNGSGNVNTAFTYPVSAYDGNWHMVTFRLGTVADTVEIFLDGVSFFSDVNATAFNPGNNALAIGDQSGGEAGGAQDIADLGTWERALTDQEITDLFNGGVPLRP